MTSPILRLLLRHPSLLRHPILYLPLNTYLRLSFRLSYLRRKLRLFRSTTPRR